MDIKRTLFRNMILTNAIFFCETGVTDFGGERKQSRVEKENTFNLLNYFFLGT